MDTVIQRGLAQELATIYQQAPTGGTERERRAWINGFVEAVGAVLDTLADGTSDFMADIYSTSPELWDRLAPGDGPSDDR
jgi:hypothetical protein